MSLYTIYVTAIVYDSVQTVNKKKGTHLCILVFAEITSHCIEQPRSCIVYFEKDTCIIHITIK